jgi:hypothetical protein
MEHQRKRFLTDHPMTTGYIEKREYYEKLQEQHEEKQDARQVRETHHQNN